MPTALQVARAEAQCGKRTSRRWQSIPTPTLRSFRDGAEPELPINPIMNRVCLGLMVSDEPTLLPGLAFVARSQDGLANRIVAVGDERSRECIPFPESRAVTDSLCKRSCQGSYCCGTACCRRSTCCHQTLISSRADNRPIACRVKARALKLTVTTIRLRRVQQAQERGPPR